jgi:dienelactone hydrolase
VSRAELRRGGHWWVWLRELARGGQWRVGSVAWAALGLWLVAAGCVQRQSFIERSAVWTGPSCSVERVIYTSDGYRLIGWVIWPIGDGPFPVLVINHGSGVSADFIDRSRQPIWTESTGCLEQLTESRRVAFLPEGRGYGGSEGPRIADVLRGATPVMTFLAGRAADTNAGVALMQHEPRVKSGCVAIMGGSHGAVVALLAASTANYRALVAQATGAGYRSTTLGIPEMLEALERIDAPVLLQHASNDTLVPPVVSRQLAEGAITAGKSVTYREYPGVPGVQGHELFGRAHAAVWIEDFATHLNQALAGCA